MYETLKFVLRLSPRNHELIDSLEFGIYQGSEISAEALQAYSTYLHETVHWWQHVGSSSGLLLSLSYLAQTHANIADLRKVISQFGLKKSLKRWADETLLREGPSVQEKLANANIAVNNALDVEYYKIYAFNPKKTASWLRGEKHFESVGHNYHIAYGQLIGLISASMDPELHVLPNAKKWDEEFLRLNRSRHEGYYWQSPMRVAPVGLHAIYEGQARFIQLQFLNNAFESGPSCEDWREMGYLSGIYVEAFENFLKLSKSVWPTDITDPIVGLFLLICDLAINPTRGLPLDIEVYEDFIRDVDVGARFTLLCLAVGELPHLKTAIKLYSRDEYWEISEALTDCLGYDHPRLALQEIKSWLERSEGLKTLMAEYETFDYDLHNLPIRVFFSHYISFCVDKLERPEFFCWSGVWMTGENADDEIANLWLRHLSLFTDRADKPGVYPRKWPGRDERKVQMMFENFYGTMALYDLTHQWILKEGPFVCNYEWISANYSQDDADAWANNSFRQTYGVDLKDFEF